jgi:hypothetical protein
MSAGEEGVLKARGGVEPCDGFEAVPGEQVVEFRDAGAGAAEPEGVELAQHGANPAGREGAPGPLQGEGLEAFNVNLQEVDGADAVFVKKSVKGDDVNLCKLQDLRINPVINRRPDY